MKCINTSRACQRSTLALVARPTLSKYARVSLTTRSSSVRSASFEGDELISRLPSAALLQEEIDVLGRDQIGRDPAIQIVLGHTLLGESLELGGPAAVLRHLPRDEAHGLGRARVVTLVELVAAAELGADGVPQKLHELDALHRVGAVGAAQILVEI